MSETFVVHKAKIRDDSKRLNWARIVGIVFVITLHIAAFLILLIPVVAPKAEQQAQRRVTVNLVDARPPPPPPPPPPPTPVEQPRPPVRNLAPRPSTRPPPTPVTEPPIIIDEPRDVDSTGPVEPPTPAPPPQTVSREAQVRTSSRNLNPPRYPLEALRAGITKASVVLLIDVDANGKVTHVEVERSSSRMRAFAKEAIEAAYKWEFNPAQENGVPVRSRVRIPIDFEAK